MRSDPPNVEKQAQVMDPAVTEARSRLSESGAGAPQGHAGGSAEMVTVIKPSQGWVSLGIPQVWEYRELLYFLAWRDIKVRYKQTVMGAAWAIIQPLFTMIVFSIFFGKLAKMPSDGIPYPIFTYAALLPWTYFAYALVGSSNSLVDSANLISKVYFPRLVIPMASIIAGLLDLAIAFAMLFILMLVYRIYPSVAVLTLPLFLLLAMAVALAVGLWLSALNVKYRDIRYSIPFITQFWLFATPIAYPSSLLSEPWRSVYGLNPLAGVVEGFRWALLGKAPPPGPMLLVSIGITAAMLVGGLYYFKRVEREFADVI